MSAVRVAALFLAMACAAPKDVPQKPPPPAPAPRVVIETAAGVRHTVEVELARTPDEQTRGLMYRRELPPDGGMLFLFPAQTEHAFWMRNTLIPLDMIFIDEEGRIVGIVERAEPLTQTLRSVGAPSRFVLEVNGGWCAGRGVAKGDRVRFEGVF